MSASSTGRNREHEEGAEIVIVRLTARATGIATLLCCGDREAIPKPRTNCESLLKSRIFKQAAMRLQILCSPGLAY